MNTERADWALLGATLVAILGITYAASERLRLEPGTTATTIIVALLGLLAALVVALAIGVTLRTREA